MSKKIAINGFGRIGRNVLKVVMAQIRKGDTSIAVVAINDLTDAATLAHLLRYDSVHGRYPGTISVEGDQLIVDGHSITILSERSPNVLPWASMQVDVVIESTGVFRAASSPKGGYLDHVKAGAKKVILTVPAKDDIPTMVLGVNDDIYDATIPAWSNASCTTNCLAPVVKVLHQEWGIEKGLMTTVHSYTNDQAILDIPHSDLRRSRAASVSIIPTSTGAAKAVGLVLPELNGKLDGMAMRVPTPDGSVVDVVCELSKPTTKDEVNATLKRASENELKGILAYTEDPIVSCDVIGCPESSIVDGLTTMVSGNMVKIVSWYDNEWGYSNRVVDLVKVITS